MKIRRLVVAIALSMCIAGTVRAQLPELPDAPTSSPHVAVGGEEDPHPELPADSTWAAVMVIVILLLFLAAAVIGPVVRSLAGEEMPELHDQEEQDALHASQHEPGHAAAGD